MAVLTHPVAWRRKAPRDVDADLTPEERANVKAALRFLSKRYGSSAKLATVMRTKRGTVLNASSTRGPVSAGVALRVARAAGVPLEDVLAGRWPTPGMCPHCGRG